MTQALVAHPDPARTRAWPRTRRAFVALVRCIGFIILTVGIFAGCLWLYTQYNTFPVDYHPDEGSKVEQILSPTGDRNFNHPQLLLETTLLLIRQFNVPADVAHTVVAGRWASALIAALGVTVISWIGFRHAGFGGMILVAASVGLCPPLLSVAHFMKEDACLLGGIALAVGFSFLYANSSGSAWMKMFWAALMGAGVAAACSGKYVGLLTLAPAVLVLLWCSKRHCVIPAAVAFVLFATGGYAAINHRALSDIPGFFDGFDREQEHSVSAHNGLTMSKPNGFFVDGTLEETMPHTLALAGVALLMFVPSFRVRRTWDLIMPIGFPLLFLAGLSWSVIPFPRYALPVVLMLHLLAALGILWTVDVVALRSRRRATQLVWLGAAVVILIQLPRCLTVLEQIAFDSRDRARNWLAWQRDRGSFIVADEYVKLNVITPWLDRTPARRLDTRSRSTNSISAGAGGLDDLRRQGVKYVVACSSTYDRYFSPHVEAVGDDQRPLMQRRLWYERLYQEGKLVWSNDDDVAVRSSFANPTIRIYRIDNDR